MFRFASGFGYTVPIVNRKSRGRSYGYLGGGGLDRGLGYTNVTGTSFYDQRRPSFNFSPTRRAFNPHRGFGSLTDELAQAIAQFEGFNTAGTVAQRNNNPGNLRSGPGQTGTDANGYAIFPDVATGTAALDNQINLNISRGVTLQQFFAGEPGVYAGYAPSTDNNNPTAYANFVSTQTGIPQGVPLNQLPSGSSTTGPVFGPPDVFGNPSSTPDSTATIPSTDTSGIDFSLPSTGGIDPLVLGGLALGVAALAMLLA